MSHFSTPPDVRHLNRAATQFTASLVYVCPVKAKAYLTRVRLLVATVSGFGNYISGAVLCPCCYQTRPLGIQQSIPSVSRPPQVPCKSAPSIASDPYL
jgi:hypothetical protein